MISFILKNYKTLTQNTKNIQRIRENERALVFKLSKKILHLEICEMI